MSQYNYDVFISYSREDKSFVDFLVKILKKAKLKCFLDISNLNIYDKLDTTLKNSIFNSRWLISVISPNYLQSYWCLFEAIEAIQGQDIEQRFLPIVINYNSQDQTLDEYFVLKALQDIDEQMTAFETQMIQLKAFELSEKLDKLRFVRTNLPKVFRNIHERLFPKFELWNELETRATLKHLIEKLIDNKTSINLNIDTIPLNYDLLSSPKVRIPKLNPLPTILWSKKVGCQSWKNNIVVVGNSLLISSSGQAWNKSDSEDGIYCLDAETGDQLWFTNTPADTNQLIVSKGKTIVGCDDGNLIAMSVQNGQVIWQIKLDSAVVCTPFKAPSNIGSSLPENKGIKVPDPLIVVTFGGLVYMIDLNNGKEIKRIETGKKIIADIGVYSGRINHELWLPSVDGDFICIEYNKNFLDIKIRDIFKPQFNIYEDLKYKPTLSLSTRPVFIDDLIVQCYARDTYYDTPPMFLVNTTSKQIQWHAAVQKEHFGNIRGTPVYKDDQIFFSSAYSNTLDVLSLVDGKPIWSVELGQGMFEQWSSPILEENSIFLGRHDGYLHKINIAEQKREWSMFLGDHQVAGTTITGSQELPEFNDTSAWISGGSYPILSTPVIDRGRLYIGTQEGYVFCLVNLGIDQS